MTKLDRHKAKKRRNRPPKPFRSNNQRQIALDRFVITHNLVCFKCGAAEAEWAKTGISRRGPWAICTPCTNKSAP